MADGSSQAAQKAIALVTTALQNGSIRLLPLNSSSHALAVGKANAECISITLKELTAAIAALD